MRYIHDRAIRYAAAIAAITNTRMEGEKETLAQFAERFGKKLDAQDAAVATEARKEGAPPPGAATAAEEAERANGAVDEEMAEQEEAGKRAGPTDTAAEPVDGEPEPGGEKDDADDLEEEDLENERENGDEVDEELDPEFQAAAARAKLPTSLEDIPEEARPLVKKRLKEVEAGFTRAMQDARQYRAEERFRRENPVDFIAEMLAADPELEERVSAELERRGDETYRESRKIITDKKREDVAKAIDQDARATEAREARIGEVETLTTKACEQFGIPFGRAVEAAIANAIITSETGDVSNKDITAIVKGIAKELGVEGRRRQTEEGKQRIIDKQKGRAAAPRVRPGSGRGVAPPAPSTKGMTLEQKVAASAQRMFPGTE